jgi:hypothetical protein
MKKYRFLIALLLMVSFSIPAHAKTNEVSPVPVNLKHLDFLNEEVAIDGKEMLITHIYSEAPDYKWVDASGEGIACVDDVARAAIVYLNDYEQTHDKASLGKAKKALNFVMHMQASDGEFYNFINKDFSINKDGATSKKSFDWWASRGMWSLGQGYNVFSKTDPAYAKELKESFLLGNKALQNKINKQYGQYNTIHGYKVPAWIGGFDAMSNALLGLAEFYEVSPIKEVKDSMLKLGRGLSEYQFGSSNQYPFGAHLDWDGSPTLWHAWGSGQSFALAKAGIVLQKKEWIDSAQHEADQLFTHLLVTGMIKEMAPTPAKDEQIAYGVNMLTQTFVELNKATHNPKYAQYAGITASWFTGNNDAHFVMYDPLTGRGYDGINGVTGKVNLNSGAESTIEALMSLQSIQHLPKAMETVHVKTSERHTAQIFETETFVPVEGTPETITPDSPWSGDASYSGKLVKLQNKDKIQKEVNVEKAGEYLLYAALEKKHLPEGVMNLQLDVDGKLVHATIVSGAPDTDYLTLIKLSKPVQLSKGTHTINLALSTDTSDSLLLDNVVLQPVKEYATFSLPTGKVLTLNRDLEKEKNGLK